MFTDPVFINPGGSTVKKKKEEKKRKEKKALCLSVNVFSTEVLIGDSIGPTTGIEPATSRSAVKRSTDWANPAAIYNWT